MKDRSEARVVVAPDQWGQLHALVASHGFEGESKDDLWEQIRAFLKEEVKPRELLRHLYVIDVLTRREFDSGYSRHQSDDGGTETEIVRIDEDETDA